MQTTLRLLAWLKPHWRRLALAALLLFVATPLTLFHPLAWMFIVDQVIAAEEPLFIDYVDGSRGALLAATLAVMMSVHLAGVALNGVRSYLLGTVGQRFVLDLRLQVYQRIQAHGLPFFHRHRSGDLMARCVGDIDTLEEVALHGIDEFINSILQFVVVAGVVIWLQWVVGALTLLPLLGVAILVKLYNARVKGLYRAVRDRLGDVSGKLQENLSGILTIKAYGSESLEQDRFDKCNRAYYDTAVRAVLARSIYSPSVMSVGFLSNVVMIGVGGWFVLQGAFTVGGLVAYRGYWWQLFSPVQILARINEMLLRAGAAASRVFELLDEPLDIQDRPDAVELKDVRGHLTLERVCFAYPEREGTLRDVSFEVAPGRQIGVVGPSGAGKSTLLGLLLRLHDVDEGRVLVDGQDVREVTQQSLRNHFATVTQEPFLFNETVGFNIGYGRPDADEQAMREAAGRANALDFIESLPQGFDTLVGERGVRLSGGQKQRLCIARALLADPEILLLDEATASVEPESESIIQAALQELRKGRTAIIVSHRMSMVRDADLILVFEEGRITERGTHEELMALGGWYHRMTLLQAGGHHG